MSMGAISPAAAEEDGPAHVITELDHTILAIVGRDGPMSAYDVRKVFAGSLTPSWSASTGSVYPSIRRLVQAGLILSSQPAGGRNRTTLTLSPLGSARVRDWLMGITVEVAAATPDPVRTRLYFLSLLGPAARTVMLEQAEASTRGALLEAERRRAERSEDDVSRLISEGVISELQARLTWLGRVRRALTA
jgi:DNA-binding PadR family transcriptional regulator